VRSLQTPSSAEERSIGYPEWGMVWRHDLADRWCRRFRMVGATMLRES